MSATVITAEGTWSGTTGTLARWWRAFCAREIASQASLTEMSKFEPAEHIGGYGLRVYNPAIGYASAFGHNGLARPLVDALRSR